MAERQRCRPYLSFSMGTVGLRSSGGCSSSSGRGTGSLHSWPGGAFGGLLVPPPSWAPGATPAGMEPCRPYPSLSMGSVGLRLSRGSIGKAGRSIGRLHISLRGAVGGLLLSTPSWQPEATLAKRELCRPYLSFSMETVGLRPSGGSIGKAKRRPGRLHNRPRGAIGGLLRSPPSWQPEAILAWRECCRPYPSFSMGTVGLRRSRGSIGHLEL